MGRVAGDRDLPSASKNPLTTSLSVPSPPTTTIVTGSPPASARAHGVCGLTLARRAMQVEGDAGGAERTAFAIAGQWRSVLPPALAGFSTRNAAAVTRAAPNAAGSRGSARYREPSPR